MDLISIGLKKGFFNRKIWKLIRATDTFLKQHLAYIDWRKYCQNKNVSITFLEKYPSQINWYYICNNPRVDINFIQKYPNQIIWETFCERKDLDFNFLAEHHTKIPWEILIFNETVPRWFIDKYAAQNNLLPDSSHFCNEDLFSKDFCNSEFWQVINFDTFSEDRIDCEDSNLLIDFLDKNIWSKLCTKIPLDFLEKHLNKLSIENINKYLDLEFIRENKLLDISYLCYRKNVPFKFYVQNFSTQEIIKHFGISKLQPEIWFLNKYQDQILEYAKTKRVTWFPKFDIPVKALFKRTLFKKENVIAKRTLHLINAKLRIETLKKDF